MPVRYYPAIIEGGETPGYSVFFPDLPGCTSAGDTVHQTARKAEEALRGHLAAMIEDGDAIPEPSEIDAIEPDPDVHEVARVLVRAEVPGKVMRLNISMDEGLVEAVDQAAKARGLSRSGFLAEAARRALVVGETLSSST
jgi:predicted RNase H-like HicB family nuclease